MPLIRAGGGRQDTLSWLAEPETGPARPPSSAGGQRILFGTTPQPYAAGDAWDVFPNGRVVIARAKSYRVDFVEPDGRVVRGPAVRHTPVRIGAAEREEWLTTAPPGMTSVTMGPGGVVNRQSGVPANFRRPEPASWPEHKPPFVEDEVWAGLRGETWVLRSRAASDKTPAFDVFNSSGELARRVSLSPGSRLVGFGAASIYIVRTDDDGLEYLQRYQY